MAYERIEELLDLARTLVKHGKIEEDFDLNSVPPTELKGTALTPAIVLFLSTMHDVCPQFDNVVCGATSSQLPEELGNVLELENNIEYQITASVVIGSTKETDLTTDLVLNIDNNTIVFQAREVKDSDDRSISQRIIIGGDFGNIISSETDTMDSEVWRNYKAATDLVAGIKEWSETSVFKCADCPIQLMGLRSDNPLK